MAYITKKTTVNGVKPIGSNLFGTCSTASDAVQKVVAMADFDVLVSGVTIHVYFANENTASNPTLKVGSTSAVAILCNGATEGNWEDGAVISFTYNGTNWIQNDASEGGGSGTAVPTADTLAKFDSTAHMNSTDMTTTEVSDFVDELDAQGSSLADYVAEQGTDGIWTYRKWNSGIAECWGTYTWTNTEWSAWGNLQEGTGSYTNYPTSLFNATPYLQCTVSPTSVGLAGIELWSGASASRTPTLIPIRGNAGATNVAVSVDLYAIGRWK